MCNVSFKLQLDSQERKSLATVQAIFQKFHRELNFIELFWGAVKRYLRGVCDYRFTQLEENMSNAVSVANDSDLKQFGNGCIG